MMSDGCIMLVAYYLLLATSWLLVVLQAYIQASKLVGLLLLRLAG
jgi:hypothetical protein